MRRAPFMWLVGVLAVACGQGAGDAPSGQTGAIELRLVDAPADEVKKIVVTIDEVSAHVAGGGGWTILSSEERTVDLLALQGGNYALLGITTLPAGRITQMRLHVKEGSKNYVVTPDDAQHPLKVPSGEQSGIKLKVGIDFSKCDVGNLTFDFDGKKSIHVHPKGAGAGDEWILRPVIRLKSVHRKQGTCEEPAPEPQPEEPAPPMTSPPAPQPQPEPEPQPEVPMTPPLPPDPSDPCANVTCMLGYVCMNGECGVP